MQHGFYTKEGKLHGSWESYNSDGSKKCFATYNYGLKVGVWTYWNMHKITKIEYDNDNILKIEEINNETIKDTDVVEINVSNEIDEMNELVCLARKS